MMISKFRFSVSMIIISSLTLLIAGCSVSIKPGAYPPIDDSSTYYGGPDYESYYYSTAAPPPVYNYNYDPWTMGYYYETYSGPARPDRGSDSSRSANVAQNDVRNSTAEKDRSNVSNNQSGAPVNNETRYRRDRTAIRQNEKARTESPNSPVVMQKARRSSQTSNKQPDENKPKENESQSNVQKTRPDRQNPEPEKTDKDEDKDKKTTVN